ncbi:MAG: CmcI family methyltransferase [Myxococcota bacterium]|nr:CmcI family methyltransferase [Myxococcota bacterium]
MRERILVSVPWLLIAALVAVDGWQLWQLNSKQAIADRFSIAWSDDPNTWQANTWFGIPAWQNPFDVWVTQEILWEVKPDLVIEAGTHRGGSAALWATLMEQINPEGRIVTIDVKNQSEDARRLPIVQEKVEFLVGSSTHPKVVEAVTRRAEGKRTLVILDSNHARDHVLEELRAYAPLVPVGSYIIVQDGAVNGHPTWPDFGPGPYEAVEAFLAENDAFEPDRSRERHLMTSNPMGFLKRVR